MEQGDSCVHHWMIDTPNGRSHVAGKCKKCGDEKLFKSSPPDNILYTTEVKEESLEKLVAVEAAEEEDYG